MGCIRDQAIRSKVFVIPFLNKQKVTVVRKTLFKPSVTTALTARCGGVFGPKMGKPGWGT